MIIQYFSTPINENQWILAAVKENGSCIWFENEVGTQEKMYRRKQELNKKLYKSSK